MNGEVLKRLRERVASGPGYYRGMCDDVADKRLSETQRSLRTAEADLAAARAREQRATLDFETLRAWTLEHLDSLPAEDEEWDFDHAQSILESLRCIVTGNPGCTEESDYTPEQWAVLMAARAALAAEPAATLAEPEGEPHRGKRADSEGLRDGRASSLSGSASAAANEPLVECPICGNETPEADMTYSGCPSCRAGADEPGERE